MKTSLAKILVFTFTLNLFPLAAAFSQDADYRFLDEDGNQVFLPSNLPVYSKESPGPWKGLEAQHDPAVKSRILYEGLEMSRILTVRISHPGEEDKEGKINALYVLDKDGLVVGYHKFGSKNPVLETEMKMTSVINYVEIYVECSKHGLWRKAYRFT